MTRSIIIVLKEKSRQNGIDATPAQFLIFP
jgi:hypothetical protein